MNTWTAIQPGETQISGHQPEQYLWGCQLTMSKVPEITNGVILTLPGYPSRCLLALPAHSAAPWVVYNGESCSPWAVSQEQFYHSFGGTNSWVRAAGDHSQEELVAGYLWEGDRPPCQLPAEQHTVLLAEKIKPNCHWEAAEKTKTDNKERAREKLTYIGMCLGKVRIRFSRVQTPPKCHQIQWDAGVSQSTTEKKDLGS